MRLVGGSAELFAAERLVVGDVALEEADLAVALESQDERRDPVQEPPVMADHDHAPGERLQARRARRVTWLSERLRRFDPQAKLPSGGCLTTVVRHEGGDLCAELQRGREMYRVQCSEIGRVSRGRCPGELRVKLDQREMREHRLGVGRWVGSGNRLANLDDGHAARNKRLSCDMSMEGA